MLKSLIKNLQRPEIFPHPVEYFRVIETHITIVLLTGDYAYKFKKPLDLEFLDFSTLEKRRFFCHEELRLNKMYAPELYLEVINITGTPDNPSINGEGEAIEYAVKMREFPQENLFTYLLDQHKLTPGHFEEVAEKLAGFHQRASVADPLSRFGTPEQLFSPIQQNFDQIRRLLGNAEDLTDLEKCEHWVQSQYQKLYSIFQQRKAKGFIRECHGDLHLNNIVMYHDKPVFFDCIEFNPDFRWVDVISDVGFLTMDLQEKKRAEFVWSFLNHYLTLTHDYSGLHVLKFYQTYRALVRAKIDQLQIQQNGSAKAERLYEDYRRCIDLVVSYMAESHPQLIVMHGVAGSGKTTRAKQLAITIGAIHLRTDVERKFLHKENQYTEQAIAEVYGHCLRLAELILKSGYSVIMDATFLKKSQRDQFRLLAGHLGLPFFIVPCEVDEQTRKLRLSLRSKDYSQADLEVAHKQERLLEPLTPEERRYIIWV